MFVVGRSSLRPRDVTRIYYRRFLSCPRTIKMLTRRISVASMHFDDDFQNTSPLVLPLLVHDQAEDVRIEKMPDVSWKSAERTASKVVPDAYKMGITKFFLFPKVNKERESPKGAEAYNKDGLVPRTLRLIKESCPDALIFTDIGLEMYGYKSQEDVFSVAEYASLREQALCYARAGVDVIGVKQSKSGLISYLRYVLTEEGFKDVKIMSHSGSFPASFPIAGVEDTSSHLAYERENRLDAVSRAIGDETSGAELILVKPAKNVAAISMIRDACLSKIVVFHVFNEEQQLNYLANMGMLNPVELIMDNIMSLRRRGADYIITYMAIWYAVMVRKFRSSG